VYSAWSTLAAREQFWSLHRQQTSLGRWVRWRRCRQKTNPVAFQHQWGIFVDKLKTEVGQIFRHKRRPENRAHVAIGQNCLQMSLDRLLKLFEKESEQLIASNIASVIWKWIYSATFCKIKGKTFPTYSCVFTYVALSPVILRINKFISS